MTHTLLEYLERYPSLVQVAEQLEGLLRDHLQGVPHVDRVSARAKDPERFATKAEKTENGVSKYEAPFEQIQDQLGARITVLFKSDIEAVTDVVKRYFPRIEEQEIAPDNQWTFGYFGKHFILGVPRDVVPVDVPREHVPAVFELQVKTLFQHAWSEANHDLGYKPKGELSDDQLRRFAYTAAQAWGADRAFDELCRELAEQGQEPAARDQV
ncbi:MAG: GTP pyrophosphokinase [Gemmatimonadota bacterium]